MAENQIIYIIGFMGSGKTTAGMQLASKLGWLFIDLDNKIEEKTGKSVREIFAQNGEAYFRETETAILKNLNIGTNSVISTGGGTPCFNENMEFMLHSGLTLYLRLTPEDLRNRLAHSKADRPLIKDLDQKELLPFIRKKLADREKWYNRSEMIVDGLNPDMNLIMKLIKSQLDFSGS